MIYFSGIDIGTTAVKAVAFTPTGKWLNTSTVAYATQYPAPGWAEQSPEVLWRAMCKAMAGMIAQTPGRLEGAAFSCAMHGLLGVDDHGRALTPILLWSDLRSSEEASNLKNTLIGSDIYQKSGAPIHPMLPLCKLLWWKKHHPQVFEKVKKWVSIKEYLLFKLCGQWVVDHSIAAATGLFDQKKRAWNPVALNCAGISEHQLSELIPSHQLLPPVLPKHQNRLGIPPKARFFIGSSDGCLANVGSGALHNNIAAMTIGTSAAYRIGLQQPAFDPRQVLFCYPLSDTVFIAGGASNNAGNAWQWLTQILHGKLPTSRQMNGFLEMAAQVAPGSEGLRFLPYLAGERAPFSLDAPAGLFQALSLRHEQRHLLRAVLEGVLFNLRLIGEAVETLGGKVDTIRISGGLTKSPFFAQLAADIMGKRVEQVQTEELSAFGAAILAMQALGHFKNLEEALGCVHVHAQYEPSYQNTLRYNHYYLEFQDLIKKNLS